MIESIHEVIDTS